MNGLLRGNAEGRIKGNGSWKALVGQRSATRSVGNILQGAASAGMLHSFCNFFSWKAMALWAWAWSTHFAAFIEASLYGTGREAKREEDAFRLTYQWCTRNLHKPFQVEVANIISGAAVFAVNVQLAQGLWLNAVRVRDMETRSLGMWV